MVGPQAAAGRLVALRDGRRRRRTPALPDHVGGSLRALTSGVSCGEVLFPPSPSYSAGATACSRGRSARRGGQPRCRPARTRTPAWSPPAFVPRPERDGSGRARGCSGTRHRRDACPLSRGPPRASAPRKGSSSATWSPRNLSIVSTTQAVSAASGPGLVRERAAPRRHPAELRVDVGRLHLPQRPAEPGPQLAGDGGITCTARDRPRTVPARAVMPRPNLECSPDVHGPKRAFPRSRMGAAPEGTGPTGFSAQVTGCT
jgi:hypothetical protein